MELVYPPTGLGGDTGKILANVLRIRDADLVLIDITPTEHASASGNPPTIIRYNEGVLIEFGMVLSLDNPPQGLPPWGGRVPRPSYRVFCSNSFPRSNLTPIINAESVTEYGTDPASRALLVSQLQEHIRRKVEERLTTIKYNPL
jgi:hypothetical protein